MSSYLLLNSEEAIKERLALISEAYEEGHSCDTLSFGETGMAVLKTEEPA